MNIYEGMWIDGNLNGYGRYIIYDGSYYVGQFKNDQCHGKGKYVSSEGNVEEGIFKKGKLMIKRQSIDAK